MSVFRRRRGHPLIAAFNEAASDNYYTDDTLQNRYYFDDALTLAYVTGDL